MRSRIRLGLTAPMLAVLLAACTDGTEIADDYLAHLEAHPQAGVRVLSTSGGRGPEIGEGPWMKVVFALDGESRLPGSAEEVGDQLSSFLLDACTWKPRKPTAETWMVDRLGQWTRADVTDLFSDGATYPHLDCDPEHVRKNATGLVARVAASMRVPGVAGSSHNGDFGVVTLERAGTFGSAVDALRRIWGRPMSEIDVAGRGTHVAIPEWAAKDRRTTRALGRLFAIVPADRGMISGPAVLWIEDSTRAEVRRWAAEAGLPFGHPNGNAGRFAVDVDQNT